ncbi:MAG: hypothetical protein ACFWUE_08205 [Xylanivirga thermophila]|jgi:hypothetical protein|uniref:hypothetical protein n=1 Tax=Xylanivirga thermophila TaxID=2496273 RepID=UPI001A937E3C|nr:hypothetical protein [Xylanivirga thermophila]
MKKIPKNFQWLTVFSAQVPTFYAIIVNICDINVNIIKGNVRKGCMKIGRYFLENAWER